MKATFKSSAAAVVLFAAIGATASFAQTVTYDAGDLLIGFQAHTPNSPGVTQNFMFNLGSAASFKDASTHLGYSSPIANVGSQLEALYGANWFTRSDLSWGAIGLRAPIPGYGTGNNPIIDGDGTGTIYVSKESTGVQESTPWGAMTRSQAAVLSSRIVSLTHASSEVSGTFSKQDAAAGTNGFGAIVDASLENSWSTRVPGPGEYSFGFFQGGIEGSFGLSSEYVFLDIYRYTPDGIDPNWVVTLAIDSIGNVYAISAVPEPSTYAALIGVAAMGLVFYRRSRSKKVAA